MKKGINISIILTSILLVAACDETDNTAKKSFVNICSNANRELSIETCRCIYDKQHNKESFENITNYYRGINSFKFNNISDNKEVNADSRDFLAGVFMSEIESSCKGWFEK